jgi:hypothetical protein
MPAAPRETAPETAPETSETAAVPASATAAPAENTWGPDAEPEQPRPAPSRAAPSTPDEPRADPDSEAYDFLFGDTIYRTQAGASIRIPNPDPERPGDHDGHTMLASDLGKPPAREPGSAGTPVSEATVVAPIPPRAVQPVSDHAPADRGQPAVAVPVGPTLQLERADGTREALNRPVLIGRSPAASGTASEARLITIVDDPDISRTHLRVAVEGDVVVVTDLGSKNGSIITLPGGAPRKLRASEPTVVLPGTLIDLGGGTTFTVREA